ncbi:PUA-like domain-containing protein [Vararia minispora EC-137]|uniref:PUA-like domain-containing protein n=1 Tax=Vararia minispora EC-137 TaxID=1314806 RepID=A0ACB8QIT4_9AGAM|nr:PUA-like domain-containing protein [Vararia minispora EC-137]
MPTPYELDREVRIRRNKALLDALGIKNSASTVLGVRTPVAAPAKPRAPRKRKTPPPSSHSSDTDSPEPASKTARTNETGLRRSARNAGKSIDYNKEKEVDPVRTVAKKAGKGGIDREPGSMSKRIHDPKVFGAIPGVKVGDWWETREECSTAAIHAPWVAGISGSKDGAYSIALSGGYEDDVDLGDAFTFTGAGGRDLKGTKQNPKNLRTAPQSCDQTFDNAGNHALLVSSQTKRPVRVIRGYKLKSPFAPPEGYRYDGLYTVEKAWQEPGMNPKGYLVCKFALKRVSGQLPLTATPAKDDGEEGTPTE